jgi:2-polyprenyl-3-methyl-5-hydroxy-6-metoxy-1,4-benzoquinol methylase
VKWFRALSFAADHNAIRTERWHCHCDDGSILDMDVSVRMGKPMDVLSLKGLDLDEVRDYADSLADTARRLYGSGAPLCRLQRCVCCCAPLTDDEVKVLTVFDIPYVRCSSCGHVLVPVQPSQERLRAVFADSEAHSSPYVDPATLEIRLRQIVTPKLHWCLEQFAAAHAGRQPASVIDVGAGGGHFLAGAARAGLRVEGFELSKTSRAFAAENFGLSLRGEDFLAVDGGPVDLVTFWGLLEYVPEPAPFIAAARRALAGHGMLVVEVPRVDALGTAAQAAPGSVVARHMDPTTHINSFSDESLMTLLVNGGFKPVAAWYFGMDIYELLVQTALRLDNAAVLESMAELIPLLQQSVDLGRQCDDLIVAAVLMTD